ncbi:MAG: hypothetical protein WD595_04915 [Waddliaceae bacterium]
MSTEKPTPEDPNLKHSKESHSKESDKHEESASKKIEDTLEKLKKNENVDTIVNYAQTHVLDTVAYILLVIGIIWSFFHPVFGGLLVGLIAGWYFYVEIYAIVKGFQEYIDVQGTEKSIVLGAVLLVLLVQAPGVVIGALLMSLIRGVLTTKSDV